MLKWKNVILGPNANISDAIQVLERDDPKIVMVVDDAGRLLGTITDGDIRRSLLKGFSLEAKISVAMNGNPKVVRLGEDRELIRSRMEKWGIRQIPILDEVGVVYGLETLKNLSVTARRDNPVFIMAGGFGTRLKPLTDTAPKPMLKVGGKPILEHIIEGFVEAGFHEFYISTHYKAKMIREYFGDGGSLGIDITYVHEDQPLGTAGSLGLLPESMTELPIVMINGDVLTRVNFSNLVDFHEANKGEATVCVKDYEIQVPYGVIEGSGIEVVGISEKPVKRFYINAGIYVLNPSLRKAMDGTSYIDMPDLLESIMPDKGKVIMFPIHEYWLDIGRMDEFERAQDAVDWIHKK